MNLDLVPQREENMTPYEMMLSESQERMLMVLKPGKEDMARAIFEKWELDFAIIGTLTDTGRMVLRHKGEMVADLPIDPLALASPEYDRPWEATPARPPVTADDLTPPDDLGVVLETLVGCSQIASKRWIWEQYDHMVMGDTIARPGGDAAMVRIHGTGKGLAMTSDCTPRYCLADPVQGGRQAVAEAWRNLTATGARPLAVTDNLNFGNPERPAIMGQLVGCIQGMGEACQALDMPVVSGNVSLYNETRGEAILPTPVIGAIGLIDDIGKRVSMALSMPDQTLFLIGDTRGQMGASLYLREIEGREDGAPPAVDLDAERANGDLVRALMEEGLVQVCHDLSDGGLLVGLAEMCMAGNMGARIANKSDLPDLAWLFAEDQARYVIATRHPGTVMSRTEEAGVPAMAIGMSGGDSLDVADTLSIPVAHLRDLHEAWLPELMSAPDAH